MLPRFAAARAALVYALCALALMYPALQGNFLVNPLSDMLSGHAYRVFGSQVLRETGGFPLWNPYILGGVPFVAAQHGDIFYPTFILRLVMPADAALNLSWALHLTLAGLFTYGYLRACALPFLPALVGGVAYMLGGPVASLASPGHDGKLYVSALTPLVLWMILVGVRDGRLWAWGVLALATGLSILSPHFQMTYYMGVLAAAYTLYLAFRRGDESLERGVALRRVSFAIGAAALGFAIASIAFLPFFQYIAFSPRGGGGRGWEYATSWSMPPEELLNAYLPQFSGIVEHYWGRNPLKLHSDYLGAVVLVLAGAAIAWPPRRALVRFWLVAGLVALLWAFGGHTPFYHLVYALPYMKVVRAAGMIYFIVSLAGAVLAAVGTERVLARQLGARYLVAWAVAAAAVATLATTGVLTSIAQTIAEPERYDAVVANSTATMLGGWRSLLFVAVALLTIWALSRGRLGTRSAGWVLVALAAFDLWTVERQYYRFAPPAVRIYGSNAAIDYLRRVPVPGRVISLALDRGANEAPNDPVLEGDALMIHRVRAVTGHQGNEIQRWVELAGGKSPAPPANILNRQFRRLANVKYWLTNVDLPEETPALPGMRLLKRVGPVRDGLGSTLYVYELAENNPAAWMTPVIVKAPPAAVLATVLDPRFDAARAALFDSSADVPAVQVSELPPPLTTATRVTRYDPGHITIQLEHPAPAGSALIVSENYYPGWMATVDGKPAPLARADYTLIGVAVPEGGRVVDLRFREASFERGKTLTLVALGLTGLLIVGGVATERRRARG